MHCSNCGNLVAPGEQCVTCGTVAPTELDDRPQESEEAGGSAPRARSGSGVFLVIGAVVLVFVGVVAGAFAFRTTSTVEESSGVVTESTSAPTQASSAGETSSSAPAVTGTAGDWTTATAEGSLVLFENPDADRAVGTPAPAVSGFDFEGNPVAIEDNGKPKVLIFLAHWCPHCQREVPVLQQYIDSIGLPDGVELISVATVIDEQRPNYPPDEWLDREGWTSPVIVDPDGTVAGAYGLAALPYYVFIREDFTVDFRIAGELDPQPVFEFATTLFGPAPDRVAIGPANYGEAAAQSAACGGTTPPAPELLSFDAPGTAPDASEITFTTSCGEIHVELDHGAAPETVASMLFLADAGYFDGTVCHRLVSGFVLQCGDPTATGTGGPGYVLADEFPEDSTAYQLGTVAMANAGPGTTGSQFFVILGDASFLPPQFSVIGQVSDVDTLIAALDTVPLGLSGNGETSSPLETIFIESATVGGTAP